MAQCNLCGNEEHLLLIRKYSYKPDKSFNIIRCRNCGLISISPQPSRQELKKHYSFDSGYHLSLKSKKVQKKKIKQFRKRLMLIKKYKKTGKLLDIGCSTGLFLDIAKKDGWAVQGIEFSKDTSEIARQKGLDIFTGDLLEFEDKKFDVITMWDVIEHTQNPSEILKKAGSMLDENGLLFIITPNASGVLPKLAYFLFGKTIKEWAHPEPPGHLFQFSKATLKKMLNKNNFKIIKIKSEIIPMKNTAEIPGFYLKKRNKNILEKLLLKPFVLIYQNSMRVLYLLSFPFAKIFNTGDSMLVVCRKVK